MLKIFFFIFFSLVSNFNISKVIADQNEVKIKTSSFKKLDWESSVSSFENKLNWYAVDEDEIYHDQHLEE